MARSLDMDSSIYLYISKQRCTFQLNYSPILMVPVLVGDINQSSASSSVAYEIPAILGSYAANILYRRFADLIKWCHE